MNNQTKKDMENHNASPPCDTSDPSELGNPLRGNIIEKQRFKNGFHTPYPTDAKASHILTTDPAQHTDH